MVSALNFTICSSFVSSSFFDFRAFERLISNKQSEDTVPRARKKKEKQIFVVSYNTYMSNER